MDIQLAANQVGLIGDFVPSNVAGGKKHFVTPRRSTYGLSDYEKLYQAQMIVGRLVKAITGISPTPPPPPAAVFASEVMLEASVSADFAKSYVWENANPVSGSPHLAKVSRLAS